MSLRVAALVKQIPAFESMTLGDDGRLVRAGLELEMSAYCRRAVAQAVATAAAHAGTVTVITLGPPSAEDTLREAIAWATDRMVDCTGVHVTDPAFAGSDTLATARTLAAAIEHLGAFDLVLAGRNSVDADTGQVGPELAELLGLPFVTGARHLALTDRTLHIRAEHDDGWAQVRVDLPAVVSTAERLIDPCKVDPAGRASVDAARITRVRADDLGPGPWGAGASPTSVGATRIVQSSRLRTRRPDRPLDEQVARAVALLVERGALDARHDRAADRGIVPHPSGTDRVIGVVVEPDRIGLTRELLGAAARLDADVVALTLDGIDPVDLGGWGADAVVAFTGIAVANEEDTAAAVAQWCRGSAPWAVLAPGTAWGREVAARAAAALGTGLTGDAVELDVEGDALVAWKPAFGGQLVAAIRCATRPQMVTVRAGVLPTLAPRRQVPVETLVAATPRSRVHISARDARRRPRPRRRCRGRGRRGSRRRPCRLPTARSADRGVGRRARGDAEGHRSGMDAEGAPDRHHGTDDRTSPLRLDRCQREVQPHGRRPHRRDHPRGERRSRRADRGRGGRHGRRGLPRGGADPGGRGAAPPGAPDAAAQTAASFSRVSSSSPR